MKKTLCLLAALMLTLCVMSAAAEQSVGKPISITWWHAHEEPFHESLQYMVDAFNKENTLGITVTPIYIGNYATVNSTFLKGSDKYETPALLTCNTSYPSLYGEKGLCEALDPYIAESGYPISDFGAGLIESTSYNGEQIALPYLISTQTLFYNKTAVETEGIPLPKTLDDMDAFLEKATLFDEYGNTRRYGTVIAGWDYWYFEMLYKNNGVMLLTENGGTDINSEKSIQITEKIKSWIDKGYAYFAHGGSSSSEMRSRFVEGSALSIMHTTSLYDSYCERVAATAKPFEVGMTPLPGDNDGVNFRSEIGGAAIVIPASISQAKKNAAWQFLMFMTSPEINLYWSDTTGYVPTRSSVQETEAYADYLSRKSEMARIVENKHLIYPRNQHPQYDACANLWRDALANIFQNNAPVKQTLDELAAKITALLNP